jgi:NTP pyrophosphatase (non-canonical NTP hydrolase)
VTDIIERLRAFRDARNWAHHHTPANLAQAIAVEAGELQELFLWNAEPALADIKGEVADVMIYCLNLCDVLEIDAEQAIQHKINVNERKYPAP